MNIETDIQIETFISKENVLYLEAEERMAAIQEMADVLAANGVADASTIYEAIKKREEVVSTGIGLGIALPHARLADIEDFTICIGISKAGINWKAIDNLDVKLIVLIIGPQSLQNEYLKVLSQITTILKDSTKRESLLQARNKSALVNIFQS